MKRYLVEEAINNKQYHGRRRRQRVGDVDDGEVGPAAAREDEKDKNREGHMNRPELSYFSRLKHDRHL